MDASIIGILMIDNRIAGPFLKGWIVGFRSEYGQTISSDFVVGIQLRQVRSERDWANTLSFFLQCCQKAVPAQRLNQKLHARFHAGLAFAVAIEESQRRRCQIEQLFDRQKVSVDMSQVRRCAEAAA